MKNIILCGFMGCGKTTIGKLLAKQLSMEFIDLDQQIEQNQQMSIPEIFSQWGEERFRQLEHEAVAELSRRIRCIVSTGGGALTFSRNLAVLSPQDLVVFIDASFPVCYERIKDSSRPVVRRSTPRQLEEVFAVRRPLYQKAAGLWVSGDRPAQEIADEIAREYKK